MVGNLVDQGERNARRQRGQLSASVAAVEEEKKLPLTITELAAMRNANDGEITLDYEQWQKILIQNGEREAKAASKRHKIYP